MAEANDNFEITITRDRDRIKKSANWINYIEVERGDTYYGISKKFTDESSCNGLLSAT